LTAYRQLPRLALLPSSTDEIQAIVRICKQHKLPIVARGAGTSLSGGALPNADGILLNLARLNNILEIDTDNRTATVQPGITHLTLPHRLPAL